MVMESGKVKIHSQIDNYSKIIVILAVILFSCLASSLMILSNVRNFPEEYDLLIFLPLSFCICSFIFIEAIRMLLKSVSVSLVLGTLYVRNVILPVIMAYGGCSTYANADKIYQYISQAVLLLIYEQAVIFAVIYFACKKSYVTKVPNLPTELKIDEIKFKKTGVLKLALFIMCTLVFAAFINYPQLRYYFTFLLSSQIDSVNNQNLNFLYMNTTVPGYVYWPVTYIMEVLRIILPALILIKIRMGIKTKRKEALAVLVSLVISFVFAAIMGPTKAISIFLAICFSIMLTLFYPNKYKRMNMIIMLSILFLGVVGLFISSRINGSDSLIAMEETSTMLQAYFGGVGNVANAMAVRQQFSLNILFTDILGSIAFVSCIFKNAISTPAIFNYAIYDSAAYCDQIIPMVGQGYFYFSYVLAPILSCAVTFIAMKCEKKANREINLFKRFTLIFLCVMFSVSPVIYNLNIVISITTTYILPVYALSLLIGKVKA